MSIAELLAASPAALIAVCALFGLVVGSFLNVVILRLPRMLENAWQSEARMVLEMPAEQGERLSLIRPASRCPHCGTPIAPWRNIPVLSWLLLRGRAACCGKTANMVLKQRHARNRQ